MAFEKGGTNLFDLRKARTDKGLTQEQLADMIGVVRQTISNIEVGTQMPSVETAKLIANALGFGWTVFYDDEAS